MEVQNQELPGGGGGGDRSSGQLAARGRVLQPAHGLLRTEIAAGLRRPADGQLEQRIAAQRVAVVGTLVPRGIREHAEAQHRRKRVDRPRRVAPRLDAAGQSESALRRAQQHQAAVRGNWAARKIGGHLPALYGTGRSNERRLSSLVAPRRELGPALPGDAARRAPCGVRRIDGGRGRVSRWPA